jgi:hypothetical protein
MSNSDNFTNQKESGSRIKILFIRASKDNHDALVKIGKQTDIFYRKHGVSKYVYKLNASENMMENMMDFVNLSKTISANDNTSSCAKEKLMKCIEDNRSKGENRTSINLRFRLRDPSIFFLDLKSVIKVCDISRT